jgi:hypothetical protein
MPDTFIINWNDLVVLYPTERGWKIWEDKYRGRNGEAPPHGEELKIPLWEAANIFGKFLAWDSVLPFRHGNMEIETLVQRQAKQK